MSTSHEKLCGIWPALVTPFNQGHIDISALAAHVQAQMDGGVHGLLALGTTGEAVTMTPEELDVVVNTVRDTAAGRCPLMVGVGTSSTTETIRRGRHFGAMGADYLLVVTPPYNKPTQEGLYRHFKTVADQVDTPVVLYNVPGRTGVNLLPPTVERLATHANIAGIKEASGSLTQLSDIKQRVGDDFRLLSGDDANFYPSMALGAHGVISVASNVAPRLMADLYDAWMAGDVEAARALHYRLFGLMEGLFTETSPAPAKYALWRMGRMENEVRLPLAELSAAAQPGMDALLRDLDLLT